MFHLPFSQNDDYSLVMELDIRMFENGTPGQFRANQSNWSKVEHFDWLVKLPYISVFLDRLRVAMRYAGAVDRVLNFKYFFN